MLLLSSRKSALKQRKMVLSQMHSFMAHSNCEQEREDNNNTLIVEKDLLRAAKCRFYFCWKQIRRIIYQPCDACFRLWIFHYKIFNYTMARRFQLWLRNSVLIKIEYFMRTFNRKLISTQLPLCWVIDKFWASIVPRLMCFTWRLTKAEIDGDNISVWNWQAKQRIRGTLKYQIQVNF